MKGTSYFINKFVFQPAKYIDVEQKIKDNLCKTLKLDTGEKVVFFEKNRRSQRVLIYSHGNGDDVFNRIRWINKLSSNLNVNVITYSYPGYIYRDCQPSEELSIKSLERIYKYLRDKGYRDENIIFYGFSLGTCITVQFLSSLTDRDKHFNGRVILEAPFTSIGDIVKDRIRFLGGVVKGFRTHIYIDKLKCSVMFIHGKNDSLVSVKHSEKLHNIHSKKSSKYPYIKSLIYKIEGAEHCDIMETVGIVQYNKMLSHFIYS